MAWALLLLLAASSSQILDAVRKAGDLYRQGQNQDGEKAVAEAIAMLESRREPPDFNVAWSLNNLGSLVYAQGDLDRAERFFARSRDAYLSLAPDADPRLATVLYNLAGVYVGKGRYSEAEPLYRRALAIRESPEFWNGLGFLLLHQKKYAEAESWLQKAFNFWESSSGSEGYAAVALNNLAMLRRLEGKLDESESLYQRAVSAEAKHFGPDHPEVATSLLNLAALYRARGNHAKAEETCRQALVLLEKTLGAQDPLTMEARTFLGPSK